MLYYRYFRFLIVEVFTFLLFFALYAFLTKCNALLTIFMNTCAI